jgi:hypothetical protein
VNSDVIATRIGTRVYLYFPNSGSRTKNGSAGTVTLGTLDAEYRPASTITTTTVGNTSGISAGGGINMYACEIATSGVVTFYCINAVYATQTFAIGATFLYYGFTVCYNVS